MGLRNAQTLINVIKKVALPYSETAYLGLCLSCMSSIGHLYMFYHDFMVTLIHKYKIDHVYMQNKSPVGILTMHGQILPTNQNEKFG